MTVYIVIVVDRHTDDEITVCSSLAVADAVVAKVRADYCDYRRAYPLSVWRRDPATEHRAKWPRYWRTFDDGPTIRVEAHELREAP